MKWLALFFLIIIGCKQPIDVTVEAEDVNPIEMKFLLLSQTSQLWEIKNVSTKTLDSTGVNWAALSFSNKGSIFVGTLYPGSAASVQIPTQVPIKVHPFWR